MNTLEEIPYTKEEIKAMVKTIAQLRKEKKELVDRIYDFIKVNAYKYGKVKFVDDRAAFDFRTDRLIEDLRKAMEE